MLAGLQRPAVGVPQPAKTLRTPIAKAKRPIGEPTLTLARAEARHRVGKAPTLSSTDLVEQLTERELAVLRYLPTQMSQREIAVELFVSLNTVKTHCSAIFRKLGVSDRKAAVQAARSLSIL